jgi:hypothetical protein
MGRATGTHQLMRAFWRVRRKNSPHCGAGGIRIIDGRRLRMQGIRPRNLWAPPRPRLHSWRWHGHDWELGDSTSIRQARLPPAGRVASGGSCDPRHFRQWYIQRRSSSYSACKSARNTVCVLILTQSCAPRFAIIRRPLLRLLVR